MDLGFVQRRRACMRCGVQNALRAFENVVDELDLPESFHVFLGEHLAQSLAAGLQVTFGVTKDQVKGRDLINQACQRGSELACLDLGLKYFTGIGGIIDPSRQAFFNS